MKQEKDVMDNTINSEPWWKHCGFESFEKWQEFMLKRIIEVSEQLGDKKKRNKYSIFSEEELGCIRIPCNYYQLVVKPVGIELI